MGDRVATLQGSVPSKGPYPPRVPPLRILSTSGCGDGVRVQIFLNFIPEDILMNMGDKTQILDNKQVSQRLNRLAWQVYEQCSNETEIIAAGIGKNGYVLAQRIGALVESISGLKVNVSRIELNKDEPLSQPIKLEVDAETCRNKTVLVIDDVSNSGKTLMYGVKPFLEFPVRSILTLVLVDRDHNRYPVKTNFVGLSLSTTLQEHISVVLSENGDSVTLD